MKTISVVIPTYNEEENIPLLYQRLKDLFREKLRQYAYEFIFIDNCSEDQSRSLLRGLSERDPHVKCIFNAKNFGFTRSTFYGLTQATGDCGILLFSDMQDPPELIEQFVEEWENGYKIVLGIKTKSKENFLMYQVRTLYYKLIKELSDVEQIEHFTGFGLYDKAFLRILRELDDPMPYLRGIVGELGYQRKEIPYVQEKRKHGKTHFGFLKLYDLAMLGVTSYSKAPLRIATWMGFFIAAASFLVAGFTFVRKLLHWTSYNVGIAAIAIGIFFLGAVQLIFIGLLGEYILNINVRTMRRPLVVEEERINFEKPPA